MSGRVPWSRYSGEDVEAVVAVMLLRLHPHGRRIRPSQGDGGLDVVIPRGPRSAEVYQVKRFATALSASHKTKITASWNRMLSYTRDEGLHVTAWHVVRPIDPTREDITWLDNLTAGSSIPCDWVGLSTVDGWAARFPDVIDYYFGDGKQRVLDTVRVFLEAAGVDRAIVQDDGIAPDRALDSLAGLCASLNSMDPHYRYRLAADESTDDSTFDIPPDMDDLMYSTAVIRDGVMARVDVLRRYDQAAEDRPSSGEDTFSVRLLADTPGQQEAIENFFAYGVPLENIEVDLSASELPHRPDMTDMASVFLSIVPLTNRQDQRFDLVLTDEDQEPLAVVPLIMASPTTGVDGRGRLAWTGRDVSGVLSLTIYIDPGELQARLSLSYGDISGTDPSQALEALGTLAAMRAGTALAVHAPGGPAVLPFGSLTEDPYMGDAVLKGRLEVCAALAALQRKIPMSMAVPDMAALTVAEVHDWVGAAILLTGGEIVQVWTAMRMTLADPTTRFPLPCWVRVTRALTVHFAGRDWPIGHVDQQAVARTWTPTSEDGSRGVLTPGEDSSVRIRLAQDEQAPDRASAGTVSFAAIPSADPADEGAAQSDPRC